MTDAAARPRRMTPEARRAQLVDAAVGVFAQRGDEDVSLEGLAAAAGITRNLLYRYFDSRADILRAAVGEAVARIAAGFLTDPARPLDEKLPRNLALWLDAVEHEDPAVRLVLRAGHYADPEVAATVRAARDALTRAIASNHLGDTDPSPAVLAALDGYLVLAERLIERWSVDGAMTRAEVERVLADVLPPLVAAVG